MSENLIQSGQLKLNAVNLRSSTGFVLDITPQTAEIVIHESLTEMFLSGEVTISENVGLMRRYPIIGGENVFISWATPTADNVEHKFTIYRVSDIIMTQNVATYKIFFVSDEYYKSHTEKFSKSYSNMSISDIVKNIYADYIIDPEVQKKLVVEETLGKKSYTLPYMNAFEAVHYFRNKCVSKFSPDTATYLFYETIHGFYFTTITYLAEKYPFSVASYQYYPANLSSATNTDRNLTRIESYAISNPVDQLNSIKNGNLYSRMITCDSTFKKISTTNYSYDEEFEKTYHLNPYKCLPYSNNSLRGTNMSFYTVFPKSSYSQDNILDNDECQKTYMNRIIQMENYFEKTLEIIINGDSRRTVGELVTVTLNTNEAYERDKADVVDPYLSGDYIIAKITHILSLNTYKMNMSLIKDSQLFPYPDAKNQ